MPLLFNWRQKRDLWLSCLFCISPTLFISESQLSLKLRICCLIISLPLVLVSGYNRSPIAEKFVIFNGHKSGDKIEKFWSQCLLFLKECQTSMKADEDLQISPMARSRDIFSFSYQFSMDNCKLIFFNHCLTTAKIFKIIEN